VTKKGQRIAFGTKIAVVICLFFGLFYLSWGAWIIFSGFGTRPAGIEYLLLIVGAIFVIVGIIVIFTLPFMSSPKEEP
jgi:uncharacterized membrane protein HdeD (DUF308 family)